MTARRFSDRPRARKPGAGRPRKSERTRSGPVDEEIVGAAAKLFATRGVGATTMAEIAEAVGLGVSSIYYYFANKHAVLERIVVDVNSVALAIASDAAERFDDAPARLHSFIRRDAAALCELPFDINEIHRLAGEEGKVFERYWTDREQLLGAVTSFISQGIDDGDFVPVDPLLAAVTVLSNDEAVQNWYRPGRERPDKRALPNTSQPSEIGEFVADLALRGLLVDASQLVGIGQRSAEQ